MFTHLFKTGGCIGVKQTDNNWSGINILDYSQPTKIGNEIWKLLQENFKSLKRLGEDILKMSCWEEYQNGGLCPYCGKFDVGHPCNISAEIFVDYQVKKTKIAPDPKSENHTHMKRKSYILSSDANLDGLVINWVYIIHPDKYELEVFRSALAKGTHKLTIKDQVWTEINYQYVPVGLFSMFNDNEPDWEEIERKGNSISTGYFFKYRLQGIMKSAQL